MSDYESLVDALRACVDTQDDMRLTAGEIACLIVNRHGALKQAALDAGIEYKTLAEYYRVVSYYQRLGTNLHMQNLSEVSVGTSAARDILAEYPNLRWSHLRIAKGIDKDEPMAALALLDHAAGEGMTIAQFRRHMARVRAENGYRPTRYHMGERAGWRVVVERVE